LQKAITLKHLEVLDIFYGMYNANANDTAGNSSFMTKLTYWTRE